MGIFSFLFAGPAPTTPAPKKPLRSSYGVYQDIPTDYTVIDVETSGLNACTCEILEIAALKIRNNTTVSSYQTYIRPVGMISESASKVNGLTWEKLHRQPFLEDIQQPFLEFIGDDILVGHNIGFDIKFIQTRFEIILQNKCFDTLKWSRIAFPDSQNYKLETLKANLSLSGSSHSALGDCITTQQLLLHIAKSNVKMQSRNNEILHKDTPLSTQNIFDEATYDEQGYNHWVSGEKARLTGNFNEALSLFQLSESEGYDCPVLYTSYAMVYRKLKDYEQEIAATERALQKFTGTTATWFEERRDRAKYLLTAQHNREMETQRKIQAREEKMKRRRQEQERKASMPKTSNKKAVIQFTDNQQIVQEFESISAAAKACGISTKGIRDTISGRQKHAGGYCWRYSIPPKD